MGGVGVTLYTNSTLCDSLLVSSFANSTLCDSLPVSILANSTLCDSLGDSTWGFQLHQGLGADWTRVTFR